MNTHWCSEDTSWIGYSTGLLSIEFLGLLCKSSRLHIECHEGCSAQRADRNGKYRRVDSIVCTPSINGPFFGAELRQNRDLPQLHADGSLPRGSMPPPNQRWLDSVDMWQLPRPVIKGKADGLLSRSRVFHGAYVT